MIDESGKGGKTGLAERIKKGEGGKGRERGRDGTFQGSSPFVVASSRRLLEKESKAKTE